jgi:hypothetical protein
MLIIKWYINIVANAADAPFSGRPAGRRDE